MPRWNKSAKKINILYIKENIAITSTTVQNRQHINRQRPASFALCSGETENTTPCQLRLSLILITNCLHKQSSISISLNDSPFYDPLAFMVEVWNNGILTHAQILIHSVQGWYISASRVRRRDTSITATNKTGATRNWNKKHTIAAVLLIRVSIAHSPPHTHHHTLTTTDSPPQTHHHTCKLSRKLAMLTGVPTIVCRGALRQTVSGLSWRDAILGWKYCVEWDLNYTAGLTARHRAGCSELTKYDTFFSVANHVTVQNTIFGVIFF